MSDEVRCRCVGCQGPPSCWCCNEPVFDLPEDLYDSTPSEPTHEFVEIGEIDGLRVELEVLKQQQWEPADGIWRIERTSHGRSSTLVAPLDIPEEEAIIRAVLQRHCDVAMKAIRGVYDRNTFCPVMLEHEDHDGSCGVWPSAYEMWSAIRDGLARDLEG